MSLAPALLAWIAIYALDLLTIWAAKVLRNPPSSDWFAFEGSLELNPVFVPEVGRLILFGPRFRALLLASSIYLGFVWYFSEFVVVSSDVFSFFFGALFLLEAAVIIRHPQNAALIRAARAGIVPQGAMYTPRALAYRMSEGHFMGFSLLFPHWAFLP